MIVILCGFSFLILDEGGIAKLLSSSQPKVLMLIKMQIPLSLRSKQDLRDEGFVFVFINIIYMPKNSPFLVWGFCEFDKYILLYKTPVQSTYKTVYYLKKFPHAPRSQCPSPPPPLARFPSL